jgi:D-alanine transaminase
MKELIWLNGEVSALSDATIGVEERGFQFADGVYEVARVYGERCFALMPHIDRLEGSAGGIKMALPEAKQRICDEIETLVEHSGLRDGIVYVQLTRGCCPRNHVFGKNVKPTLLFYTRAMPPSPPPGSGSGAALISVPDLRWKLCWIKSIALLANVLARNEAAAAGADEAVFVEDGVVSECSTSNLFIVVGEKLVTHPVGPKVLPGITRAYLVECAAELNISVEQRPISELEALAAHEIFITSTTREISWVGQWNGRTVGGGKCGPITQKLHRALRKRIAAETREAVNA